MENLTKKQQAIYYFLKNFIKESGYPPTIREIADGVNLSSTATVHTHLKNLEE